MGAGGPPCQFYLCGYGARPLMTYRTHTPGYRRTRLSAALVATCLLVVACGGGGGELAEAEEELSDMVSEMEEAAETMPTDPGETPNEMEVLPPEFHLPEATDPPAGYARIPAMCETEDGGAWITYAVPEEWEATSRGGGGSGSPLSTSLELGFDLSSGGGVSVDLEPESRQPDGTIVGSDGQPFESFDYDYSIGDDSTTITFDSLGNVTVGDQEIEVWVAPRDQAPDFLSTTEHKARFEVASTPNPAPGDDDGYMPASYVLTVTHDPDDVDLDDETVTTLVESLALPACTIDEVQVTQEVRFGEDFNGDGEVATAEDLMSR